MNLPLPMRVVVYHKQSTSGRVRFLRLPHGAVLPEALPALATLREPDEAAHPIAHHPAAALKAAEESLSLPQGSLAAEAEFDAWIDTPEGDVPICLAACTSIDPPFAAAEAAGGRFVAITEARGLPPVELELLRRAYEHVLG